VVAEGDYPTAKNYVVKTHPPLLPLLFDQNFNPFIKKGLPTYGTDHKTN
jgi:hypothetical protein